ncbi:MAG: carboxypeptidase-like regulatory domain-containing protein, partial [Planctomycetota bacterium]
MRGIVLVVAAFAAGLGLGLILQDDASVRTTRVVVEQPAREPTPQLDRARTQSLRELLEAIPIDRVPSGNGAITGRVLTQDGNPLPGAVVLARPHRSSTGKKRATGQRPEIDIVKLVEDRVRSARWTRDGSREATSDEGGRYSINGLGESIYYLHAYAAGYTIQPKGHSRLGPGGTLDFEARPSVRADVDVVVAGAGPPESANIFITQRHDSGIRSNLARWTRKQPWIELSPGTFELRAELTGELGGKSESQTVTVEEGDHDLRLSFSVTVKPALRLQVKVPANLPRVSIAGWLIRVPPGRTVTPRELKANGVGKFHAGTGDKMLWKDLEPGRYFVGAGFGAGGDPSATVLVDVAHGITDHTLELSEPSGEGVVKVRLLSPDGEPVDHASWRIAHRSEGSSTSTGTTSLYRADGTHILIDSRASEFEGGTHTIEAQAGKWGKASSEFDPKSTAILELRFAKPAEPEGRISGYRGSRYEGRVRFQWEDVGRRSSHAWFSGASNIDDEGRMKLRPQQPG